MKIFYAIFVCIIAFVYGLFRLTNNNTNVRSFKVTSQIYMDVSHDGKHLGRIEIGLFSEDAPKTVENFREICINGIDGKTYKGSIFHRVVEKFMIQGGDIVANDGSGSISIYGRHFEDENLEINHTDVGFVAMANRGPDTNGCQFYITTMRTRWLDGKHTIFGKIVVGQRVVHMIEQVKTDSDDVPLKPVVITDCGDSPINKPFYVSDNPYDVTGWLKASVIPLGMSLTILAIFQYFIKKLEKLTEPHNSDDDDE